MCPIRRLAVDRSIIIMYTMHTSSVKLNLIGSERLEVLMSQSTLARLNENKSVLADWLKLELSSTSSSTLELIQNDKSADTVKQLIS